MGGNELSVAKSSGDLQARRAALRVLILGVITLAAIIGVALFLIVRMG